MSDVFLLIVDIRHPVSGCNLEFGFHFNAYNRCLFFFIFSFLFIYLFVDDMSLLVSSSVTFS